jgi:hypothetical protein
MEITTIGIDLAKSVFAVSGADSSGRVVMRLKAPERKSLIERPGSPAAATSCNRPATASLASRMQALAPTGSIAISEQTRKFVALWHCGKSFGLKTGLDLRVCKPPDPGASVNQDSNSG